MFNVLLNIFQTFDIISVDLVVRVLRLTSNYIDSFLSFQYYLCRGPSEAQSPCQMVLRLVLRWVHPADFRTFVQEIPTRNCGHAPLPHPEYLQTPVELRNILTRDSISSNVKKRLKLHATSVNHTRHGATMDTQPESFALLGAGIIGLSTAIALREAHPNAMISIIAQFFSGRL